MGGGWQGTSEPWKLQDTPPRFGDWRDKLICGDNGRDVRAILANAVVPLREADEFSGGLRYNEFSDRAELHRAPPWLSAPTLREWTDHDDLHFTEWLQRHDIKVGVEIGAQAVQTVASESPYHPVRNFLDGLSWDGCQRLSSWLQTYLGTEDNDYTRAVAALSWFWQWCASNNPAAKSIPSPCSKAHKVPANQEHCVRCSILGFRMNSLHSALRKPRSSCPAAGGSNCLSWNR